MRRLYIVGTFDTKREELLYARQVAQAAGVAVATVDVGTRGSDPDADFAAEVVADCHPQGRAAVLGQGDRGRAVTAMAEALTGFLLARDDLGGVLGLGGSGNTALVTQAMRALPVGLPKLMLSTVASGNTAPYVGASDIAMMYSVVDIAGLNPISRLVIGNAANAAAGMVARPVQPDATDLPALGVTMFGVTTDCVTQLRAALAGRWDILVFHATGTGGQSMERLAEQGLLSALVDLTTTEVADHLVGGIFPCTEDRFGAVIRGGIPYVGSVGAVDMVNFGARDTVPAAFAGRRLHVHNAQVTLMRTTAEENARIGAFIVQRLNRMEGPVRFLLPLGGVSALDAPGGAFHDPAADRALFDAIRSGWQEAPNRGLVEVQAHVNAPEFAAALAAARAEVAPVVAAGCARAATVILHTRQPALRSFRGSPHWPICVP